MSEENDNATDEDIKTILAQKLKYVELSPEYWLPILDKELGITCVQSIMNTGIEAYEKLKPYIQFPWEKNALCTLLAIYGKRKSIQELQEKQYESFKEKQKQAQLLLNELHTLQTKGKTCTDDTVKSKIAEMCSALNIPIEQWVFSGMPLKEIVEKMHRQLIPLESLVLQSETLSDKDVLKYASRGLVLEGVYRTGRLEDLLVKREQLLNVPEAFYLSGPNCGPVFETKEFSSYEKESTFRKAMEKVGFSVTNTGKAGIWGFSLETSTQYTKASESDKSHSSTHEHSYICTTKYNCIPLASCYFGKNQIQLTKGALDELKSFEDILNHSTENNDTMLKIFNNFFNRFGSHINQGPVCFGGIFCWNASSVGFSAEEQTEIQKQMSGALNTYVSESYGDCTSSCTAGVGVTNSSSTGSFEGNSKKCFTSEIQLSVTKIGGPPEIDSFRLWKSALVANNKTWSVIDRGLQLTPVWDIILTNHRKDFRDVAKLSKSLINAYKIITKQDVEISLEDEYSAAIEFESLTGDIKSWNAKNPKQHLRKITDYKNRLLHKTKNVRMWIEELLSNKEFQNFCTNMVSEYEYILSAEAADLKAEMHYILEPYIYAVDSFKTRSYIMKWIYQSEHLQQDNADASVVSQLIDILEHAKHDIQEAVCNTEINEVKVNTTYNISLSVYSLCNKLREIDQVEIEFLLLSVFGRFDYSLHDQAFRHLLGLEEIGSILSALQIAYGKYCHLRENRDRAQAYLLLTCLTADVGYNTLTQEIKLQRLHFAKSHLQGVLSDKVSNLLEYHEESSINWKELESNLHLLESGIYKMRHTNINERDIMNDIMRECEGATQSPVKKGENVNYAPQSVVMDEGVLKQNKFSTLLRRLGLQHFYPQKMTKQDVFTINKSSVYGSQPQTEEELSLCYLQKLMMLDYNARYLKCIGKGIADTAINTKSIKEGTGNNFLDFEDFLDGDSIGNDNLCSSEQTHIHPMDIQMAIFHCADDFLRQYIYTKMSICQYALPLLVPNPLTLKIEFAVWPFQQIKKSWQCLAPSREYQQVIKCKDTHIASADLPLVSFIRFGNSSYSKSQILSNVISRQKHNVFFHRHCSGGTPGVSLMDGVVEIAWYCPSGRQNDIFDHCVAFTNLHGDAREHDIQFKFLAEIAAINVVLLSESECGAKDKAILKDLFSSERPLILLCSDKDTITSRNAPQKVKIAVRNRNEADLIDELTATLKHFLTLTDQVCNLNNCTEFARKLGLLVDEDSNECKEGKEMAKSLHDLLTTTTLSVMKKKFLPLQGKLWHRWCKRNKDLHYLQCKGNKSIEQHKSDIESDKKSIRAEQLRKAIPLNDLMEPLIQYLHTHQDKTKKYFLQYLSIFLDNLSSKPLTELQQKYHTVWSRILELKQKNNDPHTLSTLQQQLDSLTTQLNESSFGLEHLLREIGQIFEAVEASADMKKFSNKLSEIAAKVMLAGYPLELMDGDVAHVPLKWVGSVLDKVIEKVGDKRLFVLSVLGIQSTGKSTLLNAMFGLQFLVSAGRCTRGVFMQLLKLDEEMRAELKFDFVLVVDTEGLRTTEINDKSLNHDNELATFVIGLGNVTIINVFGENPSDMQDILQIAVQAFLRMRQIKLSPSCIFVHQNVGDITARDKNMEGRRRLQEKLDEMACIAGKQEQCTVTCFRDVIQFDINLHTYYFAHLWEGDPPMAPPNPSYSQSVQELKKILLTTGQNTSQFNVLKISELKLRIQDLWEALLAENFVFSFKNTQEIAAYNKLGMKYDKWAWQLRRYVLDVENTLHNQIENGMLDRVERMELDKKILETYNAIEKDLDNYFIKEKDRELLVQWKSKIVLKLQDLKDSLIDGAKHKCAALLQLKKSRQKLEEKKSEYDAELLKRSKQLASELKGQKLDESGLNEVFQKLWMKWMAEVSSDVPADKVNVGIDIENVLLEIFKDKCNLSSDIQCITNTTCLKIDFKKHLIMKNYINLFNIKQFKCILNSDDKQQAIDYQIKIINVVNDYIKTKEELKNDYSPSYIYEMLNIVSSMITDFDTAEKRFIFSNDYKFDLALHLCATARKKFEHINQKFRETNHPTTYLEHKKKEYFDSFKIFCQGASSTTIFAYFLCNKLKSSIQQAVYDKTAIDIAEEMKCSHPAFSGNRSKLEFHILIHLIQKEDYELFKKYIHFPKHFFEEFIEEKVNAYCISDTRTPRITELLNNRLCVLQIYISKQMFEAAEMVKDSGDVSILLDVLCQRLGNEINLPRNDLRGAEVQEIKDIDFLHDSLNEALENVVKSLKSDFQNVSVINMQNFRKKPHEILFQHVCGCWEQCPLCYTVCTNTIPGHYGDHIVQFHRPQAVIGVQWYQTNNFVIDICSSLVASKKYMVTSENKRIPYNNYRKAGSKFEKWSITPDTSPQLYWKWFVNHYQKYLEIDYEGNFVGKGEIPNEWKSISKDDVLRELKSKL